MSEKWNPEKLKANLTDPEARGGVEELEAQIHALTQQVERLETELREAWDALSKQAETSREWKRKARENK